MNHMNLGHFPAFLRLREVYVCFSFNIFLCRRGSCFRFPTPD